MIASLPPEMVTALSVELGSISLATWIDAPVTSLISLIFEPPFPISEPHCEAGTIKRRVIGGRGTEGEVTRLERSSSNFAQIRVNAFRIDWLVPITVTIRSGQDPSVMLIFAPLWKIYTLGFCLFKYWFSYLLSESFDNIPLFAYNTPNFLKHKNERYKDKKIFNIKIWLFFNVLKYVMSTKSKSCLKRHQFGCVLKTSYCVSFCLGSIYKKTAVFHT